jgi:hypothetical protein
MTLSSNVPDPAFKLVGDRKAPQRVDTDAYRRAVFRGEIAPDGRPAFDGVALDQLERNKDQIALFRAFHGNDPNYLLLWGGEGGPIGLWGDENGYLLLWGDDQVPPILPISIRIAVSKPGRTVDEAQALAASKTTGWYGVPTVALFDETTYGWVFICTMTNETHPAMEV